MGFLRNLTDRQRLLLIVASFFTLSAAIYGYAVFHSDFVRWDDGMLVFENPAIRQISPSTLKFIFTTYDPELYIPLTFLSYQVDYLIGGIHPLMYHLTNFFFHTANGLLVAWFATLFTRKKWFGLLCGALFLVHPLHTEAIMWVSGRKDLLSTFFFLLTLIYWLKWQDHPVRRTYLFAAGFFILALLSKVMAITLPVILLFIDIRNARKFSKEMFIEKIPFFVISIIFGIIGIGGKTTVVASSSLWEKILMAGKSSTFYLRKIVWPDFFSLLYPYHKDVVLSSPDFYLPIIAWAIILVVTALLWKKTRDIAFGLAFFAVTVAPTFLNFTKGGDLDVYFASDRYSYVPSIGVFIALVALASLIWNAVFSASNRAPSKFNSSVLATILGCLVIGGLAVRSNLQSRVWFDTYDLLTNVLKYYPESHVAHNNIANAWRLEGRLDDAIVEFKKALEIRPHPKIYANLGGIYRKQGKIDEALKAYNDALLLDDKSREAYMGRGLVRVAEGKYADAEADLKKAIEIDPRYIEAITNLGAVYAYQHRMPEAIIEYRRALAINAVLPDAHFNLAVALEATGDLQGALGEYATAVSLAPRSIPARINYGILLHRSGDVDGAEDQFRAILAIDPQNASALSALRQMGLQP
jgi:Tfp pilus assembly protein PilF